MPAQAEGKSRGWYRWYKRQMRNQAGRMLAIGDGANDVAMIQVRELDFPGCVLGLGFATEIWRAHIQPGHGRRRQ